MEPLRSLLFVPGNRADMLEKASALSPDALVPDMEDSVPIAEKANARQVIRDALPKLARPGRKLIPRTNALDTGLLQDDLAAVIGPHIYGVSVGKFESSWGVAQVVSIIATLERAAGLPEGSVRLVAWIETAGGVGNAAEICRASPRITAVAFGAEDFTTDMEIARTAEGTELIYARSAIAVAARAAGVTAVDTPYPNFRDAEGLEREALMAKGLGFKGKFAIHPSQVDPLNTIYTPSDEEIEYARRVLEVFAEAEAQGRGATSLDGKMIDVPIVRRAEGLLAAAEAMRQQATQS